MLQNNEMNVLCCYLNFILSSEYIKFHITYHLKMMNERKSFAFTGLAKIIKNLKIFSFHFRIHY